MSLSAWLPWKPKLSASADTGSVSDSRDLMRRIDQGSQAGSGYVVNTTSAMRVSAVYACVKVLSESVAQMPCVVYQDSAQKGRSEAPDHPYARLLRKQPCEGMTAYEWFVAMQSSLCLRGNAYALKIMVGNEVRELIPWPADRVEVVTDDLGRNTYKLKSRSGAVTTYPASRILHVKGLTTDGYIGRSPLEDARDQMGAAIGLKDLQSQAHRSGVRLSGVIYQPEGSKAMSPEAVKNLLQSFEEKFSGSGNAYRVAYLDNGRKFEPLQMTLADAQFVETLNFSVEDICRIYRVPPHLVQQLVRSTYSNIEQQALEFVKFTLGPWLRNWEDAFAVRLFGVEESTFFAKFDSSDLERGDIMSRFDAYSKAIGSSWITPNEVRKAENKNALPGFDSPIVPLNMRVGNGTQ